MKKRKHIEEGKGGGNCKVGTGAGRAAAYDRAVMAFEHEALFRALEPLGRPDLLAELGRPLTTERVSEHPLLREHYPLSLEVCFTGDSNPPPMPWTKPMPKLKRMVFEFSRTQFHRNCVQPQVLEQRDLQWGYAVDFPYNGAGLILHNRRDLSEGPPLLSRRLHNGCLVQIHWFEPFIDDVADACRVRFAEEGSKLMDMIESNHPFRESSWDDWVDRDLPAGA